MRARSRKRRLTWKDHLRGIAEDKYVCDANKGDSEKSMKYFDKLPIELQEACRQYAFGAPHVFEMFYEIRMAGFERQEAIAKCIEIICKEWNKRWVPISYAYAC